MVSTSARAAWARPSSLEAPASRVSAFFRLSLSSLSSSSLPCLYWADSSWALPPRKPSFQAENPPPPSKARTITTMAIILPLPPPGTSSKISESLGAYPPLAMLSLSHAARCPMESWPTESPAKAGSSSTMASPSSLGSSLTGASPKLMGSSRLGSAAGSGAGTSGAGGSTSAPDPSPDALASEARACSTTWKKGASSGISPRARQVSPEREI